MRRFSFSRYFSIVVALATLVSWGNFYPSASLAHSKTAGQEENAAGNSSLNAGNEVEPVGGHYVRYMAPNGDLACRAASPEEARVMDQRNPNEPLHVITPLIQPNQQTGLKIILRGTQQLEQNQAAKRAFQNAAARWEALVKTPVTVVIDVDFGSLRFGQPYPPGVIGSTSTADRVFPYTTVRNNLNFGAFGSSDQSFYAALPDSALPTDLGSATSVEVTSILQRVLGLADPNASPTSTGGPVIGFNDAFGYDFDPSDGISGGLTDFDGVAVHEIGHALGFTSNVGLDELIPGIQPTPTVWDLFRFRPGITLNAFPTAKRIQTTGSTQIFFTGSKELGLSTGNPAGQSGDQNQASHWKANEISGTYIGVMDPTAGRGERLNITENDIRAMDLFGYQLASQPSGDTTPPTVTVTSPKGGELISAAGTFKITWTATDNAGIVRQNIDYSTDGGATFSNSITTGLAGSAQQFDWSVPTETTDQGRIRITALDGSLLQGSTTSASNFKIVIPPLAIPQNLTATVNGASVRLSWQPTSSSPTASLTGYNIYRTKTSPVDATAGNRLGTFGVTTTAFTDRPSPADGKTKFFYVVTAVYNTGESLPSNEISVTPDASVGDPTPPTVKVLSPNGGETVTNGQAITINWTSTDNVGVVSQNVDLSTDSGSSFGTSVAAGLAGTVQTFNFNLPTTLVSTRARVRVQARDAGGNLGQDTSDGDFTIKSSDTEKPVVTVTSPGASTKKLVGGATFNVAWTSTDNIGVASHQILLSKDDGVSFTTTLADGVPGSAQSFSITVPNEKIGKGRIKVVATDAAGNSGEGVSSTFKVKQKK